MFENLEIIKDSLNPGSSNLLFYEDAFLKINLIQEIISAQKLPILYVDLDFLFTGFVHSKLLTFDNLSLFNTLDSNLNQILPEILNKISLEPHLVIVDSVNGLYNTLSNNEDSGRTVNSILMLILQHIKSSDSILIIPALATVKDEKWILANGRQILENENIKKISLSDRSKISIQK